MKTPNFKKAKLTDCSNCFDEKPILLDYSNSFYCLCTDYDPKYDDEGYIYKGDVCPVCNEIWVAFVRRETMYNGLVREITYAKFSISKFESTSKEDWDKNCDTIIYTQPYIYRMVAFESMIFANPSFFIEEN